MQQVGEGQVPFDALPTAAKDIQLFPHMHAPLLSGGKLAVNGCNIVFDRPNAHVVIGDTRAAIRSVIKQTETSKQEDILLTVPFNEQTLTWQIDSNQESEPTALNVHRIRSN